MSFAILDITPRVTWHMYIETFVEPFICPMVVVSGAPLHHKPRIVLEIAY